MLELLLYLDLSPESLLDFPRDQRLFFYFFHGYLYTTRHVPGELHLSVGAFTQLIVLELKL